MKWKFVCLLFLGISLSLCPVFSQEETFVFKLYLESGNGKKDTLELGVGPNGYIDCRYDSALNMPVSYPFVDTMEHIGAFIIPGYVREYDSVTGKGKRVPECNVFLKKRIGKIVEDSYFIAPEIVVIVPSWKLPVTVSWDNEQIQNISNHIYFTDDDYLGYMDKSYTGFHVNMGETSSYTIQPLPEDGSGWGRYAQPDSHHYQIYVVDSANKYHAYRNLFFSFRHILKTKSLTSWREKISL